MRGGSFRIEFAFHAMNLTGVQWNVVEQCFTGHAVVAVGVVGRHQALVDPVEVELVPGHTRAPGLIGVNIGANKDSPDRIADYAQMTRLMAPLARYLTINVSSPNTPGLRDLQDEGALAALLDAVIMARGSQATPIFLKLAPDLAAGEIEAICRIAIDRRIDALIVSNTTVGRPPLRSRFAGESGGLSGEPLRELALECLRTFRKASGGQIPLIGVGGIASADDAWARIRAGASLVQIYSALVYEGPGLARRIVTGLADRVRAAGMGSIAEAVGTE